MSDLGIIIIGRNEGDRLRRCLASVANANHTIVYVDSGSTDGSLEHARSSGIEVVELDMTTPFTAARARDAGFDRLMEVDPDVRFVQFIDGDCTLSDGWLDPGVQALEARPDLAAVCGRLREQAPENSVYNRLAQLEWEGPIGEVKACGGVALIRAKAFEEVGGFDPTIIAAEDDELCVRLRQRDWKIVRLDEEMAVHDMAMTRFKQWWTRAVRCGHAYAEGVALHGRPPERHFVPQVRSVVFWGILVPFLIIALAWPTSGASFLLLFGYVLLFVRIARGRRRRGDSPSDARLYALFCVLIKFPQALGLLRYALGRLIGRRSGIIEHKPAGDPTRLKMIGRAGRLSP